MTTTEYEVERARELREYALKSACDTFQWGKRDCCTFACDWALLQAGVDPMARWRGTYASEADGRALLAAHGGLLQIWQLGMIEAGIPECDDPRQGDVGIIEALSPAGIEPIGAIFGGKRWLMLSERGVISASAKALMHWRL